MDIEQIKQLAFAATPGKRVISGICGEEVTTTARLAASKVEIAQVRLGWTGDFEKEQQANIAFIVGVGPDEVLQLIARIEEYERAGIVLADKLAAAEKEVSELSAGLDKICEGIEFYSGSNDGKN